MKESENKKSSTIESVVRYRTKDGKEFDTLKEAEDHEKKLNDPNKRIADLEKRVFELENEIVILKGRLDLRDNVFPHQPIIKYPDQLTKLPAEPGQVVYDTKPKQTDWVPFQKPEMVYFGEKHSDCAPIQDGHADVGPSYTAYNPVELDKMSDDELHKLGYQVVYGGHKRAIIPPTTKFDFDDVAINYAGNSGVYGDLDKNKNSNK